MKLRNKTVLITGGAKRIGKSIGIELAKRGTNIIVHYNTSKQEAKCTVQKLQEFGIEVSMFSADLRTISNISDLIDSIENSFGSLDLIINNAANFKQESLLEVTEESWNHSLAVNLRAPFFIIQKALPLLKKNTTDKLVVNISDLSGKQPWMGYIQHGISNVGLIHLTKILARELAPQIRINCVIAGPILPPSNLSKQNKKWKTMINNIPLKKAGGTQAITSSIIYLAKNEFLTGSSITIDGGEHLIGPINH